MIILSKPFAKGTCEVTTKLKLGVIFTTHQFLALHSGNAHTNSWLKVLYIIWQNLKIF